VGRIQSFADATPAEGSGKLEKLRRRLSEEVRTSPGRSILSEVGIGLLGGLLAVAVRYFLPLRPDQLPTLPVVVMLAIVTTFVGMWAGIATAVVGGLLSWYLFFNPFSWSLSDGTAIPLLGFAVIATVIITTAHLFRSTARHSHERELARVQAQADNAELFAREMAHRMKNALAIVQAIAFQTIGTANEDATKFAGRLKALADANDLLNEHVEMPSANLTDVIEAAVGPFHDVAQKFDLEIAEATIPAQQVVSLAMALHELATNAIKYGSLSGSEGRVAIKLRDEGDHLTMTWKERDGPSVKEPRTSGFGTRLLRRSGMNTRLFFEEDGLRCSMTIRKA